MYMLRHWICFLLIFSGTIVTASADSPEPSHELVPGVALSQGITEITGVAISPLLGVSSVGVWRYWHTPPADRHALPWYAQPWAWGTGFSLLGLCFLKDSFGTAVPGLLKKPLDMVELFENKASALVASSAFVPLVAHEMMQHVNATTPLPSSSVFTPTAALVDLSWLMVPAAVGAFLTIWVCSHAINVLIILSPFSTLDALLKLARTALLVLITLAYAIAPWLGVGLCIGVLMIAAYFAPAALRLAIFGACYAGDILLPGRAKRHAHPAEPHAFTLGRSAGLPPRTAGRISLLPDGSTVFRYRRAGFLHQRSIPLPDGPRQVERGIFSPSLIHHQHGLESKILLFLPRYRGHEDSIASHFRLLGVRDHPLKRGLAAAIAWLRSLGRRRIAEN